MPPPNRSFTPTWHLPGRPWSVLVREQDVVVTRGATQQVLAGPSLSAISVRSRVLPVVQVTTSPGARLRGLTPGHARALTEALRRLRLRVDLRHDIDVADAWRQHVDQWLTAALEHRRWVTHEQREALVSSRPSPSAALRSAEWHELVEILAVPQLQALRLLSDDLRGRVDATNERILELELRERADFFTRIEKSPLTQEQARAVVTFDNRVQVVAAAGSGKTSVMVARAAYAVHRGLVAPDRILLLAFNKAAAEELEQRVRARFAAAGLPHEGIRATTFHAFGLDVIAQATGKKPRPAPWLEGGQDLEMLLRIVDELRDSSPAFRARWDLFRLLFARASDDQAAEEPDHWDPAARRAGFHTARGETVRSHGERIIADWLFLNGVEYEYEKAYCHDVADREHSQYRPDFYYPAVDVWHEHWALGHDGRPPAEFAGYADSMRWKQQLHQSHGTRLVETTWAEIVDVTGLESLAKQLTSYGVELDWNPDRPRTGAPAVKHEELVRLVRTFMAHVKGAGLTRAALDARLAAGPERLRTQRTRLFLDLYWDLHAAWEQRLRAEHFVDFEDMLVQAADALEAGVVPSDYDLVMVDELQDASQARARLVRGLLRGPGKHLLAVGDDWQGINRFAGADLSVMTSFADWFGEGPTLRLQTTFRSPQAVTDVAGRFVAKNPRQLHKDVVSAQRAAGGGVSLLRVPTAASVPGAIARHLEELAGRVAGERPTVDVLGRYHADAKLMPSRVPRELDVRFRTVHSAKGLEADYVVVPNLTNSQLGFPSRIVDDPVLRLAMADPDDYPHAEERRLFYVALTRARREVLLITVVGSESPFVTELLNDGAVTLHGEAAATPPVTCPSCSQGLLVPRTGRYGEFLGCNRFPRCRHTGKATTAAAG